MNYLVDTSVLIQSLLSKPKLNAEAVSLLEDTTSELFLSSVSSWEIAIKVATGKLSLPESVSDFFFRARRLLLLRPLDITHTHALAIEGLPQHHRDPFDRMLIVQARIEGLTLLTIDRIFQKYDVAQIYCER